MATLTALVCVAIASFLSGCATTSTAQYNEAFSHWTAREYAKTLTAARKAQDTAQQANDVSVRDHAAYLAGLAAYQLEKMDEASRSFATAMTSTNQNLAGMATAMQGAVAMEQGRWGDAAANYSKAAGMLKGRNAEEARERADAAEERAQGRRPIAPQAVVGAKNGAKPVVPAERPATKATGSLTIVVGTFTSEVAARQRSSNVTEAAKRAGLGAPRVVPASAPDRRVWIVEVGSFSDRSKAEAALKLFPGTDAVVSAPQRR